MQRGRAAIRFLSACHQGWCDAFPDLQSRGQWQIVLHLGVRGRGGVAVGELQGLVRQALLLDDATVRDRIGRLIQQGFCVPDPPGAALSARSVVIPTHSFLAVFDGMILDMGAHLAEAANDAAGSGFVAPAALDLGRGRAVVDALEGCRTCWIDAVEAWFRERNMSRARAVEARRHLLGGPHWLLTHLALEHALGLSAHGFGPGGIQADRLAGIMVEINGQNFQTTRDHINELIGLGLLERRAGRSMHVGLPPAVLPHFLTAMGTATAALPGWAAPLRATEPDVLEHTATTHRAVVAPPPQPRRWQLTVHQPPGERRAIPLESTSVVIGRSPGDGATITLAATDVSRRHCRIEVAADGAWLTDLESTNGTHVDGTRISGTVPLPEDTMVAVGPYVFSCGAAEEAVAAVRRPSGARRNKSGKSANMGQALSARSAALDQ